MSAKTYPERVQFVLCDDIRQESSGKVTLIGAFPGGRVVVLGPTPPTETNAVAIFGTLAFAFFASGGEGDFEVRLRVQRPDGSDLFDQPLGRVTLRRDAAATIGTHVQPFVVPEFGAYCARLVFNDREYAFEFVIAEKSDPVA